MVFFLIEPNDGSFLTFFREVYFKVVTKKLSVDNGQHFKGEVAYCQGNPPQSWFLQMSK